MKLIHLSDLHLGKRVNEFPMLDDQVYILTKIINIIDDTKPDAVIIAGDVYDKSVPPTDAVALFDDFLYRLAKRNLQVFIISGNHDSPERIAFGSKIMCGAGIHMSPVYSGAVTPITLSDEFGVLNIYMLPFVKPIHIRRYYPEERIESYTDALDIAIKNMPVDNSQRNIIVTHQFVTGAQRSESEEISVGGSDNVDISVFDDFDYVALGHLHAPQKMGRETIRYSGTPLKYSLSECNHEKSVTVVEMRGKGDVEISTIPLIPRHDMRSIRGSYMELTARSYYDGTATDDYLHITLTDENDIPDAIGKLRVIYPNLMKIEYDNKRTRENPTLSALANMAQKSPLDLFGELYEKQNNQPMSKEQSDFVADIIESIWEGEK